MKNSQEERHLFIQHLQEPYRTVVRLHDIERWSYGKIAYKLCRRVGTVKAQICRGRRKLLHLIEQQAKAQM